MKVSIHQPNYFPWLGFFYKVYLSDTFIFLDDVQFSNQGMHNYHFVKTPQGPFRMKIPVEYSSGDIIKDVRMKDELQWRVKHLKTIEMNYKKSPFFDEIFADLNAIYSLESQNLAEFNINIIKFICDKFNFTTKFVVSSALNITTSREQKVIDLCKSQNATVYLSGTGAKIYQDENNFLNENIALEYLKYTPVIYDQLWGDYQANVFIVDYLMNCGYDWNRVIENQ